MGTSPSIGGGAPGGMMNGITPIMAKPGMNMPGGGGGETGFAPGPAQPPGGMMHSGAIQAPMGGGLSASGPSAGGAQGAMQPPHIGMGMNMPGQTQPPPGISASGGMAPAQMPPGGAMNNQMPQQGLSATGGHPIQQLLGGMHPMQLMQLLGLGGPAR